MRIYPVTRLAPDPVISGRGQKVRRLCVAATAMVLVSAVYMPAIETAHAGSAVTGVQAALTPASQSVTLGSDVFFDVMVTQPSAPYSGWDGTLEYDPQALTYVATQQA